MTIKLTIITITTTLNNNVNLTITITIIIPIMRTITTQETSVIRSVIYNVQQVWLPRVGLSIISTMTSNNCVSLTSSTSEQRKVFGMSHDKVPPMNR